MIEVAGSVHPLMGAAVLVPVLVGGAYVTAVLDSWMGAMTSGRGHSLVWAARLPGRRIASWLVRPPTTTERPDIVLWVLAPAVYAGLAGLALSVLPLGERWAVADVRTGIVVLGSAEVLAMVAVYLHGWSANSPLPLTGAYRFLASGLSFLLLSMFVLIAAALPAESLSFGRILASQQDGLWNVVRQPLGLPLFLVVALGVSFYGPLDFSDGRDLAAGTAAESSGAELVAWEWARHAMLTTYAIATAVVFFAGPAGPLLPGPVWLAIKSVAILALFVWIRHRVGRIPIDRFVGVAWTVLLPASFVHLAIAGVVTLS